MRLSNHCGVIDAAQPADAFESHAAGLESRNSRSPSASYSSSTWYNQYGAHGGFESNPVMAHTIGNFGSLWPVQKLVMLACCLPIMLRWSAWKVAPFVALMGLVVANNLLAIA